MSEFKEIQSNLNPEVREKPQQVSFKWIYTEHTPEYADEVINAVNDCDVLAIELYGGSIREREGHSSLANDITHDRLKGSPYRRALRKFRPENDYGRDNGLDHILLAAFRKSNKDVIFIDASNEDKKIRKLGEKAFEADKDFFDSAHRIPIEESILKLKRRIERWAAFNKEREEIVARQLKEFIKKNSLDKTSIKIGVIQGSTHTPSSNMMKEAGYSVERIFIPFDKERKPEKFIFSYSGEAERIKKYFPEKIISKELLERALLEYFVSHATRESKQEHRDQIANLSDQDVHTTLQRVNEIITSHKGSYNRVRVAEFIIDNPLFNNLNIRKAKISDLIKILKYKISHL